ncbi:EcsC family protein [Achromobacter aloeverae]|uniref:Peptidase n=1 Tax=Achromobacter aloeverae TaxID=1750518 RepID=A0A4Q1HFY6_9BURK|nr:EcsC family protein [Achromobacter aloeverae]RXN84640.1 peptidase [Achromobacter aloeverae]
MPTENAQPSLSPEDLESLQLARDILENPSLTARLSNYVGKPIEYALDMLPAKAGGLITEATQKAIHAALKAALMTMGKRDGRAAETAPAASRWLHKAGAAVSGGVGGFFGLAAVTVELPVSVTIMMRAIADVARGEGADLDDVTTQLDCVQVLGLGGRSKSDDAAEVGYFAAREAMAKAAVDASAFLATGGKLGATAAPPLVRLINAVASRFGVQVTEKVAAQAVPVIGAAAGALINTAFTNHYQQMARGHFVVRRLEGKYGKAAIEAAYQRLGESSE